METITFKQPPTLNKLINTARTNRFVAAKEKKDWTHSVAVQAAKVLELQYKSPFIAAEISYKKANSDLDNLAACFKPILDGLVKAGILPDDNLSIIRPIMLYKAVKIKMKEDNFLKLYLTDCPIEYKELALKFLDL